MRAGAELCRNSQSLSAGQTNRPRENWLPDASPQARADAGQELEGRISALTMAVPELARLLGV